MQYRKRPLYIRMTLKYTVKKKYKCSCYGRIRNIYIIVYNASYWTRCCCSLHLLSIPIKFHVNIMLTYSSKSSYETFVESLNVFLWLENWERILCKMSSQKFHIYSKCVPNAQCNVPYVIPLLVLSDLRNILRCLQPHIYAVHILCRLYFEQNTCLCKRF
jgi:hypothetical protein